MSKQDRQGVRTPADLEMKYNFGKSFAEVMGIANDARDAADKALGAVDNFDNELDSEEIFNRLTENGALQGLYREDGQLYINASYIKSGSIFSEHSKVFFAADYTEEDRARVEQILLGTITPTTEDYQRYDIWGDGKITQTDMAIVRNMTLGRYGEWLKIKWNIAITPSDKDHFIRVFRVAEYATGETGTETEVFNLSAGGVNALTLVHSNLDGILSFEEGAYGCFVRNVDGEKEWLCPPMFPNTEYRTTERYQGDPVYTKAVEFGNLPNQASKNVQFSSVSATVVSLSLLISDGCVISAGYGKDRNFSEQYGLYLDCTKHNVRVLTEADFSSLTATAVVKYTKD